MYTKKLLLFFVLIPIIFFLLGFFLSWHIGNNPEDNRNFIISLINKNKPYFVNGIARIPGFFGGFSGDVVIFTDNKGQKHELPTSGLSLPVQYWAALDNDLDVPISKDSFVPGAKIIVTLGVNPDNGEIKSVWLEFDKSRS